MKTILTFLLCSFIGYSQSQYLNPQFGNNGVTCMDIPGFVFQMGDLVKINQEYYGLTNFIEHNLVKLSEDGNMIPSFGTNGYVPVNIGSGEGGIGYRNILLRTTPDNNSFIMISSFDGQFNHHFITKTDLNGNIVSSFGTNGYIDTWGTDHILFLTAEVSDNEIIMIGSGNTIDPENLQRYLIILKYDLNGNPITSFGNNGIATIDIDPHITLERAQYLSASGDIVLLGNYFADSGDYYSLLTKYNIVTNAIDTSFGTNGYINYYMVEDQVKIWPHALYADNNAIYLSGTEGLQPSNAAVFIKKLNLNGQPDTNFGEGGTFSYTMQGNNFQAVTDVNKDNNHLTITGVFNPEGTDTQSIFLLRATSDGLVNTNFGDGGLVKTPFPQGVYISTYKTLIENENRVTIATMSDACTDDQSKPAVIQFIAGTLSANEVINKEPLTFFPNPVKDNLFIKGLGDIDRTEVYDITGKLILTPNVVQNEINLSALQAGVYVVKVYQQGQSHIIKVIKE